MIPSGAASGIPSRIFFPMNSTGLYYGILAVFQNASEIFFQGIFLRICAHIILRILPNDPSGISPAGSSAIPPKILSRDGSCVLFRNSTNSLRHFLRTSFEDSSFFFQNASKDSSRVSPGITPGFPSGISSGSRKEFLSWFFPCFLSRSFRDISGVNGLN